MKLISHYRVKRISIEHRLNCSNNDPKVLILFLKLTMLSVIKGYSSNMRGVHLDPHNRLLVDLVRFQLKMCLRVNNQGLAVDIKSGLAVSRNLGRVLLGVQAND